MDIGKYSLLLSSAILYAALLCFPHDSRAQTIDFNIYAEDNLTASQISDLEFGDIISGQGAIQVNLGEPGMAVISIAGNPELDVIVTVDAPLNLTHAGSSSDVIPLTLNWAYANRNRNDISDAVIVSGNSARFQLFGRSSGPAGPPPTPHRSDGAVQDATAYLFFFGALDVDDIDGGSYTGTIYVSVEYD